MSALVPSAGELGYALLLAVLLNLLARIPLRRFGHALIECFRRPTPPPFRARRTRQLSLGPIPQSQSQSLFFSRLPVDVRLIIYELVLGSNGSNGRVLHINRNGQRLIHCRCREVDHDIPTTQHICWHEGQTDDLYRFAPVLARLARERPLSILLACRTSYSEAVQTLYARNTFSFPGAKTLNSFAESILPQRWHSIRHLSLVFSHTPALPPPSRRYQRVMVTLESLSTSKEAELENWENLPSLLNTMRGLQSLSIQLYYGVRFFPTLHPPWTFKLDWDFFMDILRLFNTIDVANFTITHDLQIPDEILDDLSPLSFALIPIPKLPSANGMVGVNEPLAEDRWRRFCEFHGIEA